MTDSEGEPSLPTATLSWHIVALMCLTNVEMLVVRYHDIDVDPCTKYVVKVQASEDYQVQHNQSRQIETNKVDIVTIINVQGRREDFKAVSLEVHHKVNSSNNV